MSIEVTLNTPELSKNLALEIDEKNLEDFGEDSLTSPDTSLASNDNGDYDTETDTDPFVDDHSDEHEFIKRYVTELFQAVSDIPYEDKARFGDLCKLAQGREWFAKYIDSQRKYHQCVNETTFYKFVYTFALVLFECGVADDYEPAKTLMNMSFTYYYVPDLRQAFFSDIGTPTTPDPIDDITEDFSPSLEKPSVWQNANNWIKKEVQSAKQVFSETPSFNELKQNMWKKKSPSVEKISTPASDRSISSSVDNGKVSRSSSETSSFSRSNSTNSIGKIYLYEHLRGQQIWKSVRFWNQAFFLAVHAERKKRCSHKEWRNLSPEERENVNLAVSNITFGQLGTFVNNMKCLGLPKQMCRQFLNKQSIIGNISKEQMDMLDEQIDDDITF